MHYRKLNDKSNATQRIARLESHLDIKRAQVIADLQTKEFRLNFTSKMD